MQYGLMTNIFGNMPCLRESVKLSEILVLGNASVTKLAHKKHLLSVVLHGGNVTDVDVA